jgi:phage terminase large subunit-like protein
MSYAERAERYARAVVTGKVSACRYVRLACQRHLDDLTASKKKAFPYRYDAAKTNRVCAYLELLPHIKGPWALRREKILLQDWQCFVYGVPFGWLKKSNGLRRFRRTYVEVPRKNAKSTGTAGLGLFMLTADGEHGAEVYSGAGSEKQAWEVFGPARLMAKNTPELQAAYGLEVNAKSLTVPAKACKFEPIIGKPGDGASPSFSITDEFHEHDSDEQFDTMVTGMGSREQAMAWVITTAGTDLAGPCYALRTEVVQMLEGVIPNDELFGMIYTIDEGVDWTSDAALRMANPNMGVSVFEDYLKSQQRDAINSARKQNTFKTKHLNIWGGARTAWMNMEAWNALADQTFDPEQFAKESCWTGLDLSSKIDLSAAVKVFVRPVDGVDHYYVFGRYYVPEERVAEPDKRHYQGWVLDGALIATDGAVIDHALIRDDLVADSEAFQLEEVGFDPYGATQLVSELQDEYGITTVEIPQQVKHLSDPMKWTEAMVLARRLHHDGNPVLTWAISNVTARVDANENIFPRKERPEAMIDPAVGLIMAMSRAMAGESNVFSESSVTLW